jgi:hypothetical protein
LQKGIKSVVEDIYLQAAELDEDAIVSIFINKSEASFSVSARSATARKANAQTGNSVGKYPVSTEDLLKKFGENEWKEGESFQSAWNRRKSETDTKNFAFQLRTKLIKLDKEATGK